LRLTTAIVDSLPTTFNDGLTEVPDRVKVTADWVN
jgi:hypothetical protein